MEGAAEAPPRRRPLRRSARKQAPFENSQNSRNSEDSHKKEDHSCSGMQHGGKGDPFCLLSFNLFIVLNAASSFSTVRKKHTGPRQSKTVAGFASSTQALTTLVAQMRDLTSARGGAKRPSSDSLTFTHHFRLRRSPHWGPVMRKRPPLDSPRLLMVRGSCAVFLRNGLAGATRGCTRCWWLVRRSPVRSRVAVGT